MEANSDIHRKLKEITNWEEIGPLKFYLNIKSQDNKAKWEEINKCSLCLCELYEDIQDQENEKNTEIRD